MNKTYTVIEKEVGETPLSAVEKWRSVHPDMRGVKLSYAGRLDPMASGKLLVLIGEECKRQKTYRDLDKQYTFEVLLGFESDTGDVLGMAERDPHEHTLYTTTHLRKTARSLEGVVRLPFPHFSSKTIHGKPLFLWTLERKLHEIQIPIKTSRVYKLSLIEKKTVAKETVREEIFKKINSIPNATDAPKKLGDDFRRQDIRERWNALLDASPETHFQIATFSCIASSGTYMRTLAEEIGKALGTKGLAYFIHRTHIGIYKKFSLLPGFWWKKYA